MELGGLSIQHRPSLPAVVTLASSTPDRSSDDAIHHGKDAGIRLTRYAEMCGLPRTSWSTGVLNSLPPVITMVSVLYGFLIGGAVLVEIVFSWGGAGQYAVQGS